MNLEILKTNAMNAIAALLEAQLLVVSEKSGIDINVLHDYVGEPHTQEKKKRAPPKKKVPVTEVVAVAEPNSELVLSELPPAEKKKRAPPKKKVTEVVTDATTVAEPNSELTTCAVVPPPEKKKRAPPKKKVTEVVAVAEPNSQLPNSELPNSELPAPEKKKRAPPKKKVTDVVAVAEPNSELPANSQPEKKKRAPPKKKVTDAVPSNTPPDMCYLCQSKKELRSTGNSDGFVCWACVHSEENPNGFCVMCERYEEINDFKLCGRCQSLDLEQHNSNTPASHTSTIIMSDSDSSSDSSDDDSSDDELPFSTF
jgi:hypothetical protein